MKIFDQPFDENFLQSPAPLLVRIRKLVFGEIKPNLFVRYTYYINTCIGLIFLGWHLLGGASVFFRSVIFNQKRIQVDQLISESSKQLGYSFEELIWALEVHHVVSSLIWIIILLTMVFFWRRNQNTIFYLLFLFLFYFLQGIYFFGWNYITKEMTTADWFMLVLFGILIVIDKIIPWVVEKD